MLTVEKLLALTTTFKKGRLEKNAQGVGVTFQPGKEGKDKNGYYRAIRGKALSAGVGKREKKWEIRVYYPKGSNPQTTYIPVQYRPTGKGKYLGPKAAPKFTKKDLCWVFCTCEYFLFVCEVADDLKGSSTINYWKRSFYTTKEGVRVKITENNRAMPVVTNPRRIPHLCKHLIKAIQSGVLKKR